MQEIKKQNPYDIVDGINIAPPAQNSSGVNQEIQQNIQTEMNFSQTQDKEQLAQNSKIKKNGDQPPKFLDSFMSFMAKVLGKPDPLTGKIQAPSKTPNIYRGTTQEETNTFQNSFQPAQEDFTNQVIKKNNDILTNVGSFLGTIGTKLEKAAEKIGNISGQEEKQKGSEITNTTQKGQPKNTIQQIDQNKETATTSPASTNAPISNNGEVIANTQETTPPSQQKDSILKQINSSQTSVQNDHISNQIPPTKQQNENNTVSIANENINNKILSQEQQTQNKPLQIDQDPQVQQVPSEITKKRNSTQI